VEFRSTVDVAIMRGIMEYQGNFIQPLLFMDKDRSKAMLKSKGKLSY
jgi:hypothetical protein